MFYRNSTNNDHTLLKSINFWRMPTNLEYLFFHCPVCVRPQRVFGKCSNANISLPVVFILSPDEAKLLKNDKINNISLNRIRTDLYK